VKVTYISTGVSTSVSSNRATVSQIAPRDIAMKLLVSKIIIIIESASGKQNVGAGGN
jgi:hypothetical protein